MKIGSVTKLPDGRFWARGPRPRRASLGIRDTYEEADALREAAVQELAAAERTRLPGTTFRAFGSRVLAEREKEFPRSARAERSRWNRILGAPFADEPVSDLAAPAVDRWARRLAGELPRSTQYIVALLSAVCAQAVREGLLAANPCAEVRIRPPARTHDPWTYLLADEQRRLIAAPGVDEHDLLQIGCLLFTGVRDGELFALRLADVHLEGARPHIVVRYGSFKGPTKGKKIRRVPLFGRALAYFRRWLELLPTYCPKNPDGLAFPGPLGGRQRSGEFLQHEARVDGERVVVDRFRAALAAAGIVAEKRHDGRPVRAHDLRHTFAASLISGLWGPAWRLEVIALVMGHSSTTITELYAHLAPGVVDDLADRTAGLLPGEGAAVTDADGARIPAHSSQGRTAPGRRTGSSARQAIPRTSEAANPPITRVVAIAGLRALARGDVAAACAVLDERALLRLFEEALEAGDRVDVVGKAAGS